jgi:hypothetical protein
MIRRKQVMMALESLNEICNFSEEVLLMFLVPV